MEGRPTLAYIWLKVGDSSDKARSTMGLISRIGCPGVSAGLESRHSESWSAFPHLLACRSLPKFIHPRTMPPIQHPVSYGFFSTLLGGEHHTAVTIHPVGCIGDLPAIG